MLELPPLCQVIDAPEALSIGRKWEIDGLDAERVRYRGVRPGEAFTVRDPFGGWYRARLHRSGLEDSHGLVGEAFEAIVCPESPLPLALLQAVPARERIFWILQKATELGAKWILPVFTERSLGPEDLECEKAHRWPAAILRAVAQCRRGSVPVLLPPLPLSAALVHPVWQEAEVRWALAERGSEATLSRPAIVESAAILVGPEGGWTDAELSLLGASGTTPVSLGGRILRTETAALVGMTCMQHLYGDMKL